MSQKGLGGSEWLDAPCPYRAPLPSSNPKEMTTQCTGGAFQARRSPCYLPPLCFWCLFFNEKEKNKNPKNQKTNKAKKNPTPTELKASPFPRYGAISYAAMTLFETCREGQAGAESQMTPRCYLLSSNGGKGRLWWGGRIMQALVSIEAWLCLARKWGCGTISPTDPSGLELLAASTAPCSPMQTLCFYWRWCTLGIGCMCPTAAISAHPCVCRGCSEGMGVVQKCSC